jgi:hypothetical protein
MVSGPIGLRLHRRSPPPGWQQPLLQPGQLTSRGQSNRSVWNGFRPGMYEGAWQPPCVGAVIQSATAETVPSRRSTRREPLGMGRPPAFAGRHAGETAPAHGRSGGQLREPASGGKGQRGGDEGVILGGSHGSNLSFSAAVWSSVAFSVATNSWARPRRKSRSAISISPATKSSGTLSIAAS